jgi:hypothetical protein
VRLLSTIYFGAGLHRLHVRRQLRPLTRRDRVYAAYGPSRRLIAVAAGLLLLDSALLVRLAVMTLRGLDIC